MTGGFGRGVVSLALAGSLLLAACQHGGPTRSSQPLSPVSGLGSGSGLVALLVPYGSEDANNEELARSLENGARLALADAGNSRIELRVYPTEGTIDGAASATTQALNDGADAILGPVFGASAAAAGSIAATRSVPVFTFSNRTDVAGGTVYLLGRTHRDAADRVMSHAAMQGKSRVLVVHADTMAGRASLVAVEAAARAQGLGFAGAISHEFSQIGVVNVIPEIVAALEATQADLLVLTGNTAGALPMLAQMVPEAGIDLTAVQLAGITRWDIPESNLRISGLQGGWYPLPDPNLAASFSYRYQYEFNDPPHPLTGLAYDGMVVIDRILANRALPVGQVIANPAGFNGSDGIFRFNANGTIQRALAVAEVRDFRTIIVSPAPRAFLPAGS